MTTVYFSSNLIELISHKNSHNCVCHLFGGWMSQWVTRATLEGQRHRVTEDRVQTVQLRRKVRAAMRWRPSTKSSLQQQHFRVLTGKERLAPNRLLLDPSHTWGEGSKVDQREVRRTVAANVAATAIAWNEAEAGEEWRNRLAGDGERWSHSFTFPKFALFAYCIQSFAYFLLIIPTHTFCGNILN